MDSSKPVRLLFSVNVVLAIGLACSPSGPKNGEVICATGAKAPCPEGYYCQTSSNTCWKNGVFADGGFPDSGDLAVQPDIPTPGEAGGTLLDGFSTTVDGPRATIDTPGAIDTTVLPADARDAPAGEDLAFDLAKPDTVNLDTLDTPPADAGQCPAGNLPCGGRCVDPKTGGCCAASDCAGGCMTCGPSNTCTPLVGQLDPTGRCTGTCDATGACKSKLGQACQAVGGGCASGTFCAPEGICCDKSCTGSCEACDLAGSPGTCTTLAANATPRPGHTPCLATDAACAGKCDGNGAACAYSTVACGTATCSSLVYQAAGTCNTGTCKVPAPQTCTNVCNASVGGCTGTCTPDGLQCNPTTGVPQKCSAAGAWQDQIACGTGFVCTAGSCVCLAPKTTCTGACVDTQTDASNCGTCDHSCQGGTCSAGKCQPVVVAGSLNPSPYILGVDSQYVYFAADNPTGGLGPQAFKVGRTAANATGLSVLYTAGGKETLHGVVGGYLLTRDAYPKYQCNLNASTTCADNRVLIAFASDFAWLIPWRSPSPQYYSMYEKDPASGITIEVDWGSTSLNAMGEPTKIQSTFDTTGDFFDSFFAAGNYVYWLRTLGSDRSLFTSSASSGGSNSKLAGGLSSTVTIADVNAQSVLLWDVSGGTGTLSRLPALTVGTPQLLTTMVSPPSTLLATEDAAGIYWFDADGNLYRCSPSTCSASKITLATGQQPTKALYQDSTTLYWANTTPAAIMRLAK